MPTANVSLSEQQADFIRQTIEGGRFQNVSEVVRAGLHLLATQQEQERIKLEHLRRLANEGFEDIDRGDFEVITQDTVRDFLESVSAMNRATNRRPAK